MTNNWIRVLEKSVIACTLASCVLAQAVQHEQAKILPGDGDRGDRFGRRIDVHGDTVVVGALRDDDNGPDSGSAYVFVRNGPTWMEQAKLLPSDGAADDRFSMVSVDGDTVVVSSPGDDDSGIDSGSAYVFVRNGTTWTEQAKLLPGSVAAGDELGSVCVSGDTIVLGSRYHDANGANSGSAFVFVRSGTSWTEQFKLQASDSAAGDEFGTDVAIHGDTAVIGAPGDDDHGHHTGSVYVFERSGTTWIQQAKLTESDGEEGNWFGASVSIHGDSLVTGSTHHDTSAGVNTGSAYVFVRNGTTWFEQAELNAADGAAHDWFGTGVSIWQDTVVVGAHYVHNPTHQHLGAVYVFRRTGTTWAQEAKLRGSDSLRMDHFGLSPSLCGDIAVGGAFGDDDNWGDSGSAYIFDLSASPPGTPYCFGDGGGTPCPCGNDHDGTVHGTGCANGVFPSGAQLSATGLPSVSADTLVLTTTHLEPNNYGLFFQADNDMNGGSGIPFGDGLRCAGGGVIRLQIGVADVIGTAHTTVSLAAKGGVTPGDIRHYQCWYPDSTGSPCGFGFNLSNGYEITWLP